MDFDIIIEQRIGQPQRVNKLHPSYMALQFPLLFVYGEDGYSKDMKMVNVPGASSDEDRRLTIKAYYLYMLHDRVNSFNYLSKTGRLFQQYIVTAFCVVEQSRIDFIREHHNDIINEYLSGIYDAIRRRDNDGSDCGKKLILPQSFTGGPRYMYAHYLDALAICRIHGNPSYFITFTCNVKWPEIAEYMLDFPMVTTADRANIVDRVFEMKIHQFVKYLRDAKPFGNIISIVYTVEFQKHGLLHCHTLIWVDESSRIQGEQDIDNYISAELPSNELDPEGHRVVAEFMIHGPCGQLCPTTTCMKNTPKCTKHFPKEYCTNSYTDTDGFVHYHRRDTGITTTKQNVQLDNGYIVPYKRQLLNIFYAHINVEHCGWTRLIKYLFKYISKGTDKIAARITRSDVQSDASKPSSSTQPRIMIDEIKNYLDSRYIGPHEACWRLFEFDIHFREPAVQLLAVHAENMQRIVFRETDQLQSVADNPHKKRLLLRSGYSTISTIQMEETLRIWISHPNTYGTKAIGIGSDDVDLTCIQLVGWLMCTRQLAICFINGCCFLIRKDVEDIRTFNHVVHLTYRAACEAMGLLGDDKEWETTLIEASSTATPTELRTLFTHILTHCQVSSPLDLWKRTWKLMSNDIPYVASISLGIPNLHINPSDLENYTKYEFEACLNHCSRSLADFGISLPPENLMAVLRNRLLMEEKSYDRQVVAAERDKLLGKLNNCQRDIFNLIMHAVVTKTQELIFVYGHGGTGKTFLWKTIIYALRAEGKIVLAVASSGIASLLLPSGRTAHSRFKLPLDLNDSSVCPVTKNTHLATLLKETDLIIWDESPMNDRKCFETLDRTLKDLLDTPSKLFGGKPIMLGGDFRQTLPVKQKASRTEIISSSIAQSYLWRSFRLFVLTENMRLTQGILSDEEKKEVSEFASWLLNVGDGLVGVPDETDPDNASWIKIPTKFQIPDDENGLTKLIEFIYDQQTLLHPNAKDLQDKAIVCPKNDTADVINAKVMNMLHGQGITYISNDEAIPQGHDGGEVELLYRIEYLNTLNFAGIPPHELNLKPATPIMLLRNINIADGLCNGMHMIIKQLLPKVIEAQIITGTRAGQKAYIPRIPLTIKDPKLPFIFKRKQLHVKICYAMTINKSQGQSLKKLAHIFLNQSLGMANYM